MAKCSEITKLLIPYLENLLSEDRKQMVAEHLAQCDLCRAELGDLKAVGALLRENREALRAPGYEGSLSVPVIRRAFAPAVEHFRLIEVIKRPVVVGLTALVVALLSYLIGVIERPGMDNNDIQFYIDSYNQASGVEIIAFVEPEER